MAGEWDPLHISWGGGILSFIPQNRLRDSSQISLGKMLSLSHMASQAGMNGESVHMTPTQHEATVCSYSSLWHEMLWMIFLPFCQSVSCLITFTPAAHSDSIYLHLCLCYNGFGHSVSPTPAITGEHVVFSLKHLFVSLISCKNYSDHIISRLHMIMCARCLPVVLGEYFMKEQNESLACGCWRRGSVITGVAGRRRQSNPNDR